jgi:hypothetical protein
MFETDEQKHDAILALGTHLGVHVERHEEGSYTLTIPGNGLVPCADANVAGFLLDGMLAVKTGLESIANAARLQFEKTGDHLSPSQLNPFQFSNQPTAEC